MKVTQRAIKEILNISTSDYNTSELTHFGFDSCYKIRDLHHSIPLEFLLTKLYDSEYRHDYVFNIHKSDNVVNVMLIHKTPYGLVAMPHFTKDQIREAAYYIAEKDNFAGDASNYWLAAEHELFNIHHSVIQHLS